MVEVVSHGLSVRGKGRELHAIECRGRCRLTTGDLTTSSLRFFYKIHESVSLPNRETPPLRQCAWPASLLDLRFDIDRQVIRLLSREATLTSGHIGV